MRRALLLLAALAAPALAHAQTSGEVVNGTTRGSGELINDDKYINLDECSGVGESGPLELLWNVMLESGAAVDGGTFRVYATSKAVTQGTTTPAYCPTVDDENASPIVYAGQVGVDVSATVGQTTENADVPTADLVTAATADGFTCSDTLADQTITVCVHYFAAGSGTATGSAVGELTLSLRRPPAPTGLVVDPGDEALNVRWSDAPDPSGNQVEATGYRVVVTPQGGVGEAIADVTGTSVRVTGLVNEQPYDVAVYGLSVAKNPSLTAATDVETPKPVSDFWDVYDTAGGQEAGGCAAGAAGPLALLGVALLAVLRRRK